MSNSSLKPAGWLDRAPGFGPSVAGLLYSPIRWIRAHRIAGGLAVGLIVLCLCVVAVVPMISTGTRDARRAEGEQMLGSMAEHVRAEHAKGRHVFDLVSDTGLEAGDIEQKYFNADRTVRMHPDGTLELTARPSRLGTWSDGVCTCKFRLEDGEPVYTWSSD